MYGTYWAGCCIAWRWGGPPRLKRPGAGLFTVRGQVNEAGASLGPPVRWVREGKPFGCMHLTECSQLGLRGGSARTASPPGACQSPPPRIHQALQCLSMPVVCWCPHGGAACLSAGRSTQQQMTTRQRSQPFTSTPSQGASTVSPPIVQRTSKAPFRHSTSPFVARSQQISQHDAAKKEAGNAARRRSGGSRGGY